MGLAAYFDNSMSKLILDLSSPDVAAMVSEWQEGGRYQVELLVTQGPTKGNLVEFDVEEITDYGDSEEVEEVESEEGEEAPVPEPTAVLMERKNGKAKKGEMPPA